jgi:hypothetical protein
MRIATEVFEKLDTLDDLIDLIGKTKEGFVISEVGNTDQFKRRLEYFKEVIKNELPEFTMEELLKFDEHYDKVQKLYKFSGFHYLFAALEFEQRKNIFKK